MVFYSHHVQPLSINNNNKEPNQVSHLVLDIIKRPLLWKNNIHGLHRISEGSHPIQPHQITLVETAPLLVVLVYPHIINNKYRHNLYLTGSHHLSTLLGTNDPITFNNNNNILAQLG